MNKEDVKESASWALAGCIWGGIGLAVLFGVAAFFAPLGPNGETAAQIFFRAFVLK